VTALAATPAPKPTTVTTVPEGLIPGPNLIGNGKFVLPLYGGSHELFSPYNKSITGWVAGGGGVMLMEKSFAEPPPNSTASIRLSDGSPGSITQVLPTVPGWSYVLGWYQAGYEGQGPAVKVMHVWWDDKLVDAPSFDSIGKSNSDEGWTYHSMVVTATGPRSTLKFADATPGASYGSSIIGEVSLAGDAALYLPTSIALGPSGKLLAIVRSASGNPITDPALRVTMQGTWKQVSYAPASTLRMAVGQVVDGEANLQLHLPATLVGHTILATVTVSGKDYLSVTKQVVVKIK
jgi:hypothetical protein